MKISRLGRSTEPMTTICGSLLATASASALICAFVVAGLLDGRVDGLDAVR